MADQHTELLLLSLNDLNRMQQEFLEAYTKLLEVAYVRLEYVLLIKLDCINHCKEKQQHFSKARMLLSIREQLQRSIRDKFNNKEAKFGFVPFNLLDLDKGDE